MISRALLAGLATATTVLGQDSSNEPMNVLTPGVHWSRDTANVENVIPTPATDACPMYYGNTDPNQEGYYGWLTYHFSHPAVNLDECDHVACQHQEDSSNLHVKFSNQQAFDLARQHWDTTNGLVLVANIDNCGENHDRCFFNATNLDIQHDNLAIVASGAPQDPHDMIESASTEFGWWVPGRTQGTQSQPGGNYGGYYAIPGPSGPSGDYPPPPYGPSGGSSGPLPSIIPTASDTDTFSPLPSIAPTSTDTDTFSPLPSIVPTDTDTSGPSSTGTSTDTSGLSSTGASTGTPGSSSTIAHTTTGPNPAATSDTFGGREACTPPVDNVNGLPSACLGVFFDLDLDDQLGYGSFASESEFQDWIDSLTPNTDDGNVTLSRRIKVPTVFRKVIDKVPKIIKPIKAIIKKVQAATSISGSIKSSMSFKVPDRSSKKKEANTPKDKNLKQVKSPWGDAILIRAFGDSKKFDSATGKASYLNVYCVECGAQGKAQFSGRAAWTPVGFKFTEGRIEVQADIKFILKLGIDAKIKTSYDVKNTIIDVGLPGLSYGIVTIGPRISLGSVVSFNAAAEGKILAGAETGIANGRVVLDWVNAGQNGAQGFEPYFNPVFEAEGEIMVSAGLGLPVTIACGVKISKWDKSLSITDTPALKATAQIAGSIGHNNGGFSGGLQSANNCTGIATSLTWSNRVDIDILGFYNNKIYDTGEKTLAQKCIKLGKGTRSIGMDNTVGGTAGGSSGELAARGSTSAGRYAVTRRALTGMNRFFARQNDTGINGTSGTNGTDTIVDLTSRIKGNDTYSYDLEPVKPIGYNQTENSTEYSFSLMVDSSLSTMLVACSNGNLYLAGINATDLSYCNELFSSFEDLFVLDGSSRYVYYYNNTMNKLGVSRLRVAHGNRVPNGGVPVVMVPYAAPTGDSTAGAAGDPETDGYDSYAYYALDVYDNLLYPVVCTYVDGTLPRMFLVQDFDQGPLKLQDDALRNTVTGGKIDECVVMDMVELKTDDGSDYVSLDTSPEVIQELSG